MYVVTFYSFKGGVGRSMSLVNVAVQLAQSGRKVLLVDFDLEAPGLPTFSLKKPEDDIPGIVEYVLQYCATGESPDVMNFVYESESFEESGGSIYMMPVGRQDASYSHRLNSIDWQNLYSEKSGYLFFEDLKNQWAQCIAPDYVLIDSRTGHSDVEGICTRQLPNAVCLLFFPNEQNLNGLRRIVSNINIDNKQLPDYKKITVHFAVSNVPDLDDEEGILGKTMQRFKAELGYKELAAEIHHYNSLSLLNQEIFSLTRPNSRLTKEYKLLTRSITKNNLSDREVALEFLKSAHRDLTNVMKNGDSIKLDDKLQGILTTFPRDGEICFHAALVFIQLGNIDDALSMLNGEAIDQHYKTARMYATRARLNHRLGKIDEAVNDLTAMLDADGADIESFLDVVSLINQFKPELYDLVPESRAFRSLPVKDQIFIVFRFEGNEKQFKVSITILQKLLKTNDLSDTDLTILNHMLALALIGTGDFKTAVETLTPANVKPESLNVVNVFNLAMATWGLDQTPPLKLFEIVTMKADYLDHSANFFQCVAISYALLKNNEQANIFLALAAEKIAKQTAREFSAWSYSKVSPKEFLFHLEEIKSLISDENILPQFITRNTN
ncbi:MAG: AAA family ATPase [Methylococcales bacterium]